MRFSTATIVLGLVACEAYASAIPADLLRKRGPPGVITVRPPPVIVRPPPTTKPNDPNKPNNGDPVNAGQDTIIAELPPLPEAPPPAQENVDPDSMLPADTKFDQHLVEPIVAFDAGVAKPPNLPAPRAPDEQLSEYGSGIADPGSMEDAIDVGDLDESATAPSCAAKRDLHQERAMSVSNEKRQMSGDKYAMNLASWQAFWRAINDDLNGKIKSPIVAYGFGGISGLALGSRGGNGKTGDIDLFLHPDTDKEDAKQFWKSVQRIKDANKETVGDEFINPSMEKYTGSSTKAYVVHYSTDEVLSGGNVRLISAYYPYQLVLKMSRIAKTLKKSSNKNKNYSGKDKADSVSFIYEARKALGGQIDKATLRSWGRAMGKDTATMDDIIATAGPALEAAYPGSFAADVVPPAACGS